MIDFIDQPYDQTPVGQRLMFVAQSDNYTEFGFKYVFYVPDLDAYFYIQPNPSGVGMFDLAPIIRDTLKHVKLANQVGVEAESESVFRLKQMLCYEGWLVNGVFTINDEVKPASTDGMYFWLANYEVTDGYKPNPRVRYGLCEEYNNYMLSERYHETHTWVDANKHMTNIHADVFIPTQDISWGIMYTHEMNSPLNYCGSDVYVEVRDIDDGLVSMATFTLTNDGGQNVDAFGIYPENLRAAGVDLTDWHYYKVYLIGEGGPFSKTYVFYKVDTPCDTPTIRLQWANTVGGVDYFDFTRSKELSYDYERKRYQKVIGTYADSSFTFNTYDRGVTERPVVATKGLQINSNWISAGEFTLLQTLILSNDVYIVQTDGSQIPVVVEDTSYICRDERAGRLWNLSLKLRYSQAVGL